MDLTSFDVETDGDEPQFGLQPFRALTGHAWITCWATARLIDGKAKSVSVPACPWGPDLEPLLKAVDKLRMFLRHAARQGWYIVGWNTAFDVAWLIALGLREEVFACRWLDGMLLYKHLTAQPTCRGVKPYNLKQAVADFYPEEAGYEEGVSFHPVDVEDLIDLMQYNGRDAEFTVRLARQFIDAMTPEMLRCALLEALCIPMVAETHVTGIKVNTNRAMALSKTLEETATVAFFELCCADQDVTKEVLASPLQLGQLLYTKWGLTAPHLTDTGQPSTDKEALTILGFEDDRANLVREYREAKNNRTKFCEGLLKSVDYNGDGFSRPSARIAGAYTGRMTFSSKIGKGKDEVPAGFAIHQMKNAPEFRGEVEPPEGYDLIEHDFSGQEYRWMAVESGDETMLAMCAPGEDAHSFMASCIFTEDYRRLRNLVEAEDPAAQKKRKFGKVGNLSCQYRTQPPTLQRVSRTQHNLNISLDDAERVQHTYVRTYTRVPEYWRRQINRGRRNGYVETLGGRRVQLTMPWPNDLKWGLESTAINFPIQGVGADQKYLAMAALRSYLPKVNGHFYFDLHDGLYSIAPKHLSEKAAVEIRTLLSNLPYEKAWGVKLPIGFPVEAKVGPSWGELRKVH
jgi:DNA polymerase I-like protein with 3'-5' exonuclease and polymerase domains